MNSPLALGLEAMVANLSEALEQFRVELSFHQGRRITSVEVKSVQLLPGKSLDVEFKGGRILIQRVCRLEDWPADEKTLRSYALQARVQPAIACFYVHPHPDDVDVESIPVEPSFAPALIAP